MLDNVVDRLRCLQSRTAVAPQSRTENCKYCNGTGRTGLLTMSKGLGLATWECVYCSRDLPKPSVDQPPPAVHRRGFAPPTAAPRTTAPVRTVPQNHISAPVAVAPSVVPTTTSGSYSSSYESSCFVPMPQASHDRRISTDSGPTSASVQQQDVHPVYRPLDATQMQSPGVRDLTYEGQYLDGVPHGNGMQQWPDGQIYEGQYVRGKKHGTGRFVWANSSCYQGDFYEDMMSGIGVVKWNNGCEYQGQWQGNVMHGRGFFKWPDGRVYDGEYCNDLKEGKGSFRWPDGRLFEGEWRGGHQHGIGTYTSADGKKRKGIWNEGKPVQWL